MIHTTLGGLAPAHHPIQGDTPGGFVMGNGDPHDLLLEARGLALGNQSPVGKML